MEGKKGWYSRGKSGTHVEGSYMYMCICYMYIHCISMYNIKDSYRVRVIMCKCSISMDKTEHSTCNHIHVQVDRHLHGT